MSDEALTLEQIAEHMNAIGAALEKAYAEYGRKVSAIFDALGEENGQ